jgi:cell division protein FtsX
LGALLADALLIGLIISLNFINLGLEGAKMDGFGANEMLLRTEFILLSVGILIFGTFLGWLSSTWAVSRFLNKNLDQLM